MTAMVSNIKDMPQYVKRDLITALIEDLDDDARAKFKAAFVAAGVLEKKTVAVVGQLTAEEKSREVEVIKLESEMDELERDLQLKRGKYELESTEFCDAVRRRLGLPTYADIAIRKSTGQVHIPVRQAVALGIQHEVVEDE